jgi:hypothetical protein
VTFHLLAMGAMQSEEVTEFRYRPTAYAVVGPVLESVPHPDPERRGI